jgi:hypothetical protein
MIADVALVVEADQSCSLASWMLVLERANPHVRYHYLLLFSAIKD